MGEKEAGKDATAAGQRSGSGTSSLWEHLQEDERRKMSGAYAKREPLVAALPPALSGLPEIPEVAGAMPDVNALYLQCRRVPDVGQPFVVGICRGQAELLAWGTLGSFAQHDRFTDGMAALGYRCVILDSTEKMHQCDLLYVQQAQEQEAGELPAPASP
jgi:hypothetical protein